MSKYQANQSTRLLLAAAAIGLGLASAQADSGPPASTSESAPCADRAGIKSDKTGCAPFRPAQVDAPLAARSRPDQPQPQSVSPQSAQPQSVLPRNETPAVQSNAVQSNAASAMIERTPAPTGSSTSLVAVRPNGPATSAATLAPSSFGQSGPQRGATVSAAAAFKFSSPAAEVSKPAVPGAGYRAAAFSPLQRVTGPAHFEGGIDRHPGAYRRR